MALDKELWDKCDELAAELEKAKAEIERMKAVITEVFSYEPHQEPELDETEVFSYEPNQEPELDVIGHSLLPLTDEVRKTIIEVVTQHQRRVRDANKGGEETRI